MKKNLWIAVVLALVLTLGACSHAAQPAAGSEAAETEAPETAAPTETPAAETAQPEIDYDALYAEKLQEICAYIRTGNSADEIPDGLTGIRELMIQESPETVMELLGYEIRDLSGDGVPELIVAGLPVEEAEVSFCSIYAVFTVKDGSFVQPLEGWMRNTWYLLEDGTFYNFGSAGAAYSINGHYAISEDGTALECLDYYFTYEKTEGNYEDIGVYHNTTGVYDKAQAELTDMSPDDLWASMSAYLDHVKNPELTPLSAIA